MNTQERIEKMLKKSNKILQAGNKNKPKRLKPCPFCGADEESGVHIDTIVIADDISDIRRYSIICENCGAEIGTFRSPEEAVEAWSRRINNV